MNLVALRWVELDALGCMGLSWVERGCVGLQKSWVDLIWVDLGNIGCELDQSMLMWRRLGRARLNLNALDWVGLSRIELA